MASFAAFLGGLVVGHAVCYLFLYRPLLTLYHSLRMQGFVPQFTFEQRREIDPSEHIRER